MLAYRDLALPLSIPSPMPLRHFTNHRQVIFGRFTAGPPLVQLCGWVYTALWIGSGSTGVVLNPETIGDGLNPLTMR